MFYTVVANTVLVVISLLFFLVGCTSWSDDADTIRNSPWATALVKFSGFKFNFDFGLESFVGDDDKTFDYDDDTCESGGKLAFAFDFLALLCAIATLVLSGMAIKSGTKPSAPLVVMTLVTAILGFISMISWQGCYEEIIADDDYFNVTVTWGAGRILTLLGFILTTIGFICVAIGMFKGSDDAPPPTSAAVPANKV
jgi:hypothetical protein